MDIQFKMIYVTKTTLPPIEEYIKILNRVWESEQITNNGMTIQHLTEQLKKYLNITNIELIANGTLALQLAIKALGVKGEIITTPYSYVATTNAILWEGCTPVFVDVDDKSFCINPELIESSITDRTSAILATHVYGYPCDVERIQEIADRHKLKVIYDAAHAFGVKLNGESLLVHGDCSILSFHATKLFHTVEGGAVVCRDTDIAKRVFLMSKFGHIGEDEYIDIGINAKMSELHAAMGLTLLPMLPEIIESRRQCSAWYDEFLAGAALQRPEVIEGLEYNYAYYPVVFQTHKAMMNARQSLQNLGVFPRRYFYPSLNTLPFLRNTPQYSCPVSESLAMRVLSLPMYTTLSRQDIQMISSCIVLSLTSKD